MLSKEKPASTELALGHYVIFATKMRSGIPDLGKTVTFCGIYEIQTRNQTLPPDKFEFDLTKDYWYLKIKKPSNTVEIPNVGRDMKYEELLTSVGISMVGTTPDQTEPTPLLLPRQISQLQKLMEYRDYLLKNYGKEDVKYILASELLKDIEKDGAITEDNLGDRFISHQQWAESIQTYMKRPMAVSDVLETLRKPRSGIGSWFRQWMPGNKATIAEEMIPDLLKLLPKPEKKKPPSPFSSP